MIDWAFRISAFTVVMLAFFGGIYFGEKTLREHPKTEFEIKKDLDKVNDFISQCSDQYKITIANSNYQVSCDAGYITVAPYVIESFKKASENKK